MIGIGYTLPFQVLVTENIDAELLSNAMNGLELPGVRFRPIYLKPYYMAKKGLPLQGVQIYITDLVNAGLTEIQFSFCRRPTGSIPNLILSKDRRIATPCLTRLLAQMCSGNP